MPLFQKSVLNKYLNEQNNEVVQQAYQKYSSYFHNTTIQQNIINSKEEQFQEGFLRELFVTIMGYVLNPQPNFNLTTEFKNEKGAKKADGAILKDGKAVAVIELKSTKTKDLETIRQQAFDYKANHSECVFVITSNFQKLRFYINNAVEFEEFDLFILSEEQFRLLYLCLNNENLLNDLPLKVKNASILEEEQITKKFYDDYSNFKKELFENIAIRNENLDGVTKLHLYKKTQKLLDRFLFIFFAEDRNLLPPNSISRMITRWNLLKDEDAYKPLYEIYKQYFGYINTGRDGKIPADDIHEYNGGLFLPDEILDSIKIDDDILLKHTSILTNYDFESQVDVNILGHIFEHSLNEIESTTAELQGVDFDKQKSKRKKDGVFYTPKYITKYIVDNTVGKLCEEKKTELGIIDEEFIPNRQKDTKRKLLHNLDAYRVWLLQITICDPACGSGAFLNQALEFLINEHHYIDQLSAQLFGSTMVFQDVENQILEKNIFGVDINEESVDIARLSLWLRTAQRGRKLTTLNKNIKCGNSLIDDPEVAGDKAFKWEEEFPDVFARGGFDVVIGNPPYTYRNAISISNKEYYKQNYNSIEGNFDLYKFFMEKTTFLTKELGYASFIVPNTFLTANTYKKLRQILLKCFKIVEIFDLGLEIFENVVVESVIFTFRKDISEVKRDTVVKIQRDRKREFEALQVKYTIDINKYSGKDSTFNINISDSFSGIIDKMKSDSISLGKICYCTVGINTGYIKNELTSNDKIDYRYHKMLNGKDIGRYKILWPGEYIMYDNEYVKSQGDRGRSLPPEYIFTSNKILVQRTRRGMKRKLVCCLDEQKHYNLNRLSNVVITDINYSLSILLPILNSKLLDFYFNVFFNEYEVKPLHLSQLPIKENCKNYKSLTLHGEHIQDLIGQFLNHSSILVKYIQSIFSIETFSKKLKNWYKLDFGEFISELNNAIKKAGGHKLSKIDEMEWMEVFEAKKSEAQALKTEIDRTDKEIDQMVYELYGLTEEEIKIVEAS